jgi:multiple sugar transport system ATP-binding protein
MADVRFEHVYKQYNERIQIFSDLNLEVYDHEFLVLVGPSGCGKSTALRMIAGLEEISAGELFIGADRVTDVPPKDRDIAMVFQHYALYPHMSVFDNMAFSLKLHHIPRSEVIERVRRVAHMLGIADYLQRKPRELSGGQRQRVALGRAIVREPKVFLMDEPLSNLDAQLRVQTRADLARLHQQVSTTTVYVTHDQVEAMTMGDRIVVLNSGVIQQLGTPQQLYDTPANLFVAGFIGSPAMDFFDARLRRQPDESPVLVLGGDTSEQLVPIEEPKAGPISQLATADGREVIAGIRPEDLHQVSDSATAGVLTGTIEVVEHLGNEQVVYLHLPGTRVPAMLEVQSMTVRLPASSRVHVGDTIGLAVDTGRLHIFDPASAGRLN